MLFTGEYGILNDVMVTSSFGSAVLIVRVDSVFQLFGSIRTSVAMLINYVNT